MTEPRIAGPRRRTLIVAALVACAFLGLLGRLTHLQVLKHEEYSRLAESQHAKTIPLKPKRGPILDRSGLVLAVSSKAESLYALTSRVDDPEQLAQRLAPILGEPARDIARRLDSAKRFVYLKRRLPPEVAQAVRDLKEPALGFVEESLRLYPNRELAAQLVGFEGMDGRGLAGIEQSWDAHLAGTEGKALVERDALGREVTGAPKVLKPSTPGQGVMLTIDATLQYLAEKEIEAAWRRTRSKAAMAIAMDPRTGEILALAIRPTFNPNSFATATDDDRRARAVSDPFEPGSTFKAVLAAAALEEGVVRPEDRVYGEQGVITIANRAIHDWKRYGWLSFREVLQYSSNVGAIKVGLALGRDRYYRHIQAFGFGSLTGVGLPGESRGQLRAPQRWSGLSLASMSIGQEISVTALQILTAFAAIANDGRLMQPHVVHAVLDASGREVRRVPPQAVRQVVSPETAATLRQILTAVVDRGTGHRAAIPGYAVAGKTGTAQKLDPVTRVYSRKPGVLSFAGFVPAEDPRLAMLVMLDEPKTATWGSEAAAPLFAAVAAPVLRHLGIPPSDLPSVHLVRTGAPLPAPEPAAPALVGPETGEPVMPDLSGKSLRQALVLLAGYDVELSVAGRGLVARQTPAAGAPLASGALCRLELAPPPDSRPAAPKGAPL